MLLPGATIATVRGADFKQELQCCPGSRLNRDVRSAGRQNMLNRNGWLIIPVFVHIALTKEEVSMLLRDHPLMTFKGVRSWPPLSIRTGGATNKHTRGEVGILEEVLLSNTNPADRCFL